MTDVNHRRKNKKPVNQRYTQFDNGYATPENKTTGAIRVGKTDYLDKSLHGHSRKSELADRTVGAGIGNDFSNGHRGMAKAMSGAKKYVRSRIRFHENAATKKLPTSDD